MKPPGWDLEDRPLLVAPSPVGFEGLPLEVLLTPSKEQGATVWFWILL